MGQLDGLTLVPIVNHQTKKLVQVRVGFENAPGMEWILTADAAQELAEALAYVCGNDDWENYNNNLGPIQSEPIRPIPPEEDQ